MKVVILCGGRGTRIRDVADDIPKPMIPVGGLPILGHIIKFYSHWGYKEFVLCLGYKGQVIKNFFLNYDAHTRDFTITLGSNKGIEFHGEDSGPGWRITLAETGLEAGTGARVKRVKQHLREDSNFMLTYGDGVGDVDLNSLTEFHLSHGKIITITGVRPPGRFGELMSEHSGRVVEFNEKPQASAGRISGGFFVCRTEFFNYLDDSDNLMFEEGPMRQLVRDGEVMVYEHNGFWQPMDTYRDYLLLNGLYERGQAPWKVWK